MLAFETANVDAYRLLLRLEVAVREHLRATMQVRFQNWQRQIPQNLRAKIRADQADEQKKAQYGFVRLGALYYLTYGELSELCSRKPWLDCLLEGFGPSALDDLTTLAPIRNAIAHSRSLSGTSIQVLHATYMKFVTAIGEMRFASVCSAPEVGYWPDEAKTALERWLLSAKMAVAGFEAFTDLLPYNAASQQYWWGTEHAGFNTAQVDAAGAALQEYGALPSGVGAAATRARLIKDAQLDAVIADALRAVQG